MNTAPRADYSVTLGPKDKLNLYVAELIAIATTLQNLAALPVCFITANSIARLLRARRMPVLQPQRKAKERS